MRYINLRLTYLLTYFVQQKYIRFINHDCQQHTQFVNSCYYVYRRQHKIILVLNSIRNPIPRSKRPIDNITTVTFQN